LDLERLGERSGLFQALYLINEPTMRASLEQLMAEPVQFPVEITLASGEKHLLPHPDHLVWHPNTKDLVVFPGEEGGDFLLVVAPSSIVSIRTKHRKAS
jgi:hypothetical protein